MYTLKPLTHPHLFSNVTNKMWAWKLHSFSQMWLQLLRYICSIHWDLSPSRGNLALKTLLFTQSSHDLGFQSACAVTGRLLTGTWLLSGAWQLQGFLEQLGECAGSFWTGSLLYAGTWLCQLAAHVLFQLTCHAITAGAVNWRKEARTCWHKQPGRRLVWPKLVSRCVVPIGKQDSPASRRLTNEHWKVLILFAQRIEFWLQKSG